LRAGACARGGTEAWAAFILEVVGRPVATGAEVGRDVAGVDVDLGAVFALQLGTADLESRGPTLDKDGDILVVAGSRRPCRGRLPKVTFVAALGASCRATTPTTLRTGPSPRFTQGLGRQLHGRDASLLLVPCGETDLIFVATPG
jgi:hypothetical protein